MEEMEEKKFLVPESLLNELLYFISNSRSEMPHGRIIVLMDKVRRLQPVEANKDAKKETD